MTGLALELDLDSVSDLQAALDLDSSLQTVKPVQHHLLESLGYNVTNVHISPQHEPTADVRGNS